MAHSVSIDATASALNQFMAKYSPTLQVKMKQGLEWESQLPFVDCDYAYTGQDVTIGNLAQPYQKAFTPNNSESFDGITSYLRPIKVDLEYDDAQLEKFFAKWRAQWFTPDPEQKRTGYFSYMLNDVILPQAMEDLNNIAWAGEYSAPTPGTAGAVLESADGFKKNIADQVTAGRLVPLVTGAWPVSPTMGDGDVVDYVRSFIKLIPEPYRYKTGKIFMSKTKAQLYADDYRDKYQRNVEVPNDRNGLFARVDDFNKTIVGMTSMEGDDRMICTFDNADSMLIGTRTGFPQYFNFRFENEDRKLKVFSEVYRFFSFETCLHMFVSDQA
jgi:hypothetical protein